MINTQYFKTIMCIKKKKSKGSLLKEKLLKNKTELLELQSNKCQWVTL